MTFAEALRTVIVQKYATFSGRAARPEFWWFTLFNVGLGAVFLALAYLTGAWTLFDALDSLTSLALLLPSLAVAARRLHDTDRSGWWQFLPILPALPVVIVPARLLTFDGTLAYVLIAAFIGTLILLIVWLASPGTWGENRFGPDPRGDDTAEIFS